MIFIRIIVGLAVIALLIVASIVIGIGYRSLFISLIGAISYIPEIFTAVIVIAIFLSLRYAGIELDLLREKRSKRGSVGRLVSYYMLLFILSASGLIRFGMYYFEGPVIAKELATALEGDFHDLSSKADAIFATPKWAAYEKAVQADFSTIVRDMANPVQGWCGVGATVRPEIEALAQKLPGFKFLTGSDTPEVHSCKNRPLLNDVIKNYQTLFLNALKTSPLLAEDQVEEKRAEKKNMLAVSKDNQTALNALLDRLEKSRSFLFDETLHDDSVTTIRKSNSDYVELVDTARRYNKEAADTLSSGVEVENLRDTASPTAVYSSVLRRIFSIWTLLFVIGAMSADIVLIVAFANARSFIRGGRRNFAPGRSGMIPGTQVKYLWVPYDGADTFKD